MPSKSLGLAEWESKSAATLKRAYKEIGKELKHIGKVIYLWTAVLSPYRRN